MQLSLKLTPKKLPKYFETKDLIGEFAMVSSPLQSSLVTEIPVNAQRSTNLLIAVAGMTILGIIRSLRIPLHLEAI
jgi:hypothetical protein